MKVQLLLLLSALVGPVLAFTHASPTARPTGQNVKVPTDTTGISSFTVVTGLPEEQPSMAPGELATEAATVAQSRSHTDSAEATVDETTVAEATVAEMTVDKSLVPVVATVAGTVVGTVGHLVTDPPVVETAAPPTAAGDVKPVQTAAAEAKPNDAVVIEGGADEVNEGLTSGQVAGIVIGALLAVVIVIAVAIAVVRRMGKYSP